MDNPFHYGSPVTGAQFAGRRTELAELMACVRNHVNVALISPRRYGKTSLILQARERLATGRPQAAVVYTNVFLCKDLSTLAARLVASTYQLPGARWHRVRRALPAFLQRIRVQPTITFDSAGSPSFMFAPSMTAGDADMLIGDVYATLAAEGSNRPAALMLDEFQAITRHGEHLPFLLKGLADEHPAVSLVVAGSRRHLMERLVTTEAAPLYGMAQRLALGPLPEDEMVTYLVGRSGEGAKAMDAATAQLILALAGPVPNDIQHLAFDAFEIAERRITADDVQAGLKRAVAHESDLFAEHLSSVSPGQGRILVALARGDAEQIFGAAFARRVGLAGGHSVKKAIDALSHADVVVERAGRWNVADPFFAAWLRQLS